MARGLGVSLRVTASCSQGGRKYMEDTFTVAYHPVGDGSVAYAYFGIFDGHGGDEASSFARVHLLNNIIKQEDFWYDDDTRIEKAIRKGFIDTHEAMWRGVGSWRRTPSGHTSTAGTTATICFIKKNKLYIGHVGDSGVILGYKEKGEGEWRGKPLTKDHKPNDPDEYRRIENSGGKVQAKAGIWRVVWNRSRIGNSGPVTRNSGSVTRSAPPSEEIPFLAIARSLGDLWSFNAASNAYVVSPDPDVIILPLDVSVHRCLIFGTDGVWNVVTPDAAVAVIQTCEIHNGADVVLDKKPKPTFKKLGWLNPAKKLVDVALQRWSDNEMRADNTSVIAVLLDPPLEHVKENCRQEQPNCAANVCVPVVKNGVENQDAYDVKSSGRCSGPLYATPAEWVGPSPVAANVKREPLWGVNDGGNGESRGHAEELDPCHIGGCTTDRIVRVGEAHCSEPVCLTIKESPSIQEQKVSLTAAQAEEIDVCPVDENEINSNTERQQIPLLLTNCTAKLENCSGKQQQASVASSVKEVHCEPVGKDRGMEAHQNSKTQPNDRGCGNSFPNQQKMKRDHSNDRITSTPQTCRPSQSDDGQTVTLPLNQQRSRWSKHSDRKMATADRKRKRSLSDDRMTILSYLMQKENCKSHSHNVETGTCSCHSSLQKSCMQLSDNTKPVTSFLCLAQQSYRKKRTRSQSCDRQTVISYVSQLKNSERKSADVCAVNFPQALKLSTKRQSDNEKLFVSVQQKRRRSLSDERKPATSTVVNQCSSRNKHNIEQSIVSFAGQRKTHNNQSVDVPSDVCVSSPAQIRGRRSHSDDRKTVTLSVIQKKTRRSKSVDVHTIVSSLIQENNHKTYTDGEHSVVTFPEQQKRRRSQPQQITACLKYTIDEQLSYIKCKGVRSSQSHDRNTGMSSAVQKKTCGNLSVAAQAVVSSPARQMKRWGQANDGEAVPSFSAQQKNSSNPADSKQTVVSSRRKIGTDGPGNGYKCGKHWSKRKRAPSTHIGQLRRNAAETRRRSTSSVMVTSNRQLCPQSSSVEAYKSVVPCSKEEGRILRSVTAAVIAESLPIAKKLRSSSSLVQPQSRSGCGLLWKKVYENPFAKRSKMATKSTSGVCRYHVK